MSEQPDKRKEQLAAQAASLHDFNEFLARKEWRALVGELQEAMDSLQQEALVPAKTMEDALYRNFVIGKIHGMLAMSINAETLRQSLQDAFDKLEKELKDAK